MLLLMLLLCASCAALAEAGVMLRGVMKAAFNNDQFSKLPTLVVWFGHQSVFFSWSCRCSRLCPRPYFAQKFEAEPESVLNNDVHFFCQKKVRIFDNFSRIGIFGICCLLLLL